MHAFFQCTEIDTYSTSLCPCRWRFVIHGAIDGYSRMVLYLRCHDNNSAETALTEFTQATREYGVPSRVRSDKGGKKLFNICRLHCCRIGHAIMHNSIVCHGLVVLLCLFYDKTFILLILNRW